MGFLLGAYGKLAAGSRYRSLQARMMRIQSKLRRATRDVANMEKMIDRQQKSMEQQLTLQNTMAKQAAQNSITGALMGSGEFKGIQEQFAKASALKEDGTMTDPKTAASLSQQISSKQQEASQYISQMNAQADTQLAMNKQYIENQIEMMRDQFLEPLKDEEDSLQLEKDTLESQIQVAKADYEACQKMEQADVKMLAPNYTGGQG